MKIIHTADIHLGSKMDSRFPIAIAEERKKELRNTFKRMVEYAKANGVYVILLSGDVFDSDCPFRKDKDFFYSVVANNPDIDFLYLKGNHDSQGGFSDDVPDNLKLFSDKWTSYSYGGVTVSGIEITASNCSSLYSSLSLDKNALNIVMMHGQTGDGTGKDTVNIRKLKDKNIDYLALGHVHRPQEGRIDDRGIYAYCGCLEGRGFDETGEHGFVLLDTDEGINKGIKRSFIPFAERTIVEADVDITGSSEAYGAYLKVKERVNFDKKNLYRINLKGEINFDVDRLGSDLEKLLSGACCFISVKDKTKRTIDLSEYEKDVSLKGEFIRTVYSHGELDEEEKLAVIKCGLCAIDGKEIEL